MHLGAPKISGDWSTLGPHQKANYLGPNLNHQLVGVPPYYVDASMLLSPLLI